jgi:O-antigen/teichoic acid export membrane protein
MSTSTSLAVSSAVEQDSSKKHIRGSSVLLAGRFFSLGVNFAVQVLTVRYLSKSDYGAFAYALSVASIASTMVVLGLDKTITRFIPIYQEQRDYNKVFGTIIMSLGSTLSFGLALIVLVHGLQGFIGRSLINDQQAFALLLILIAISPADALDSLFLGMFAIFASPKAIFFRKHVLGPGLKLSAVLVLILARSDVYFLAVGYLAAGILGVIINTALLWRVLSDQGVFQYLNPKSIQMPWREVFGFSIPLLTSDFVFVLRGSLVVVLLEYFQSTADVATYRAVVPVARLNQVVLQSFTFLFMPLAARMFAKSDKQGMNDLYWQSAIWITVISFPVFAVSFSLAQPLTVFLFGTRYLQSGIILALLSFGYYFNAALGFNALTLRVYGKVRYIIVIDLLAMAISLGLNLVLIPRYGALGAGIGTCGTLVVHNILNHTGLWFGTSIKLFQWSYLKVYLTVGLGALGLLLFQWMVPAPIYVGLVLAALVSLLVIRLNRTALDVEKTFPEVLRFPLVRQFLAR